MDRMENLIAALVPSMTSLQYIDDLLVDAFVSLIIPIEVYITFSITQKMIHLGNFSPYIRIWELQ